MNRFCKKFVMLIGLASLAIVSNAQTYVVPTLGGSELIPIVQQQLQQLPNGGSVSEYQGKLIITTTPANYQAIQAVLGQIDQLPQTLTVAVRVGENGSSYEDNRYGSVGVTRRQVSINGQWQTSQTQSSDTQLYQVQTLSGKPASISLEQLLPMPIVTHTGYYRNYLSNRPQVIIGNSLISATQGISVIPTKLANGQIQLQITQSNDKFGSFDRQTIVNGQNLASTVMVNPNQWTTIGYVTNASQTSGNYGSYSRTSQTPIQVRVF